MAVNNRTPKKRDPVWNCASHKQIELLTLDWSHLKQGRTHTFSPLPPIADGWQKQKTSENKFVTDRWTDGRTDQHSKFLSRVSVQTALYNEINLLINELWVKERDSSKVVISCSWLYHVLSHPFFVAQGRHRPSHLQRGYPMTRWPFAINATIASPSFVGDIIAETVEG